MLDAPLRRALARPLGALAGAVDRPGITPDRLTVAGLVLGLGSAGAAAGRLWALAAVLWLLSRLIDGVDGALARRRTAAGRAGATAAGGFLDVTADFTVYGTTVAGVGIGATAAFGAPWWPFVAVLVAYYLNGTAFLAWSSIAERVGAARDDGRSLSFFGRIAEGGETIAVHLLWLVLPAVAAPIAAVWAAFVAVSAVQRIVAGYRALRAGPAIGAPPRAPRRDQGSEGR